MVRIRASNQIKFLGKPRKNTLRLGKVSEKRLWKKEMEAATKETQIAMERLASQAMPPAEEERAKDGTEQPQKPKALASGSGAPILDRELYPLQQSQLRTAATGIRALLEGGLPESQKELSGFELQRIVRYGYCILGWTVSKIALSLSLPQREISRIVISNNYAALRKRIDDHAFHTAIKSREKGIDNVLGLGVKILTDGLRRYSQDNSSLDMKDYKFVSDITANVHRISQLTKGNPTGITKVIGEPLTKEEMRSSMKELLDELVKDPLFDLPRFLEDHGLRPEDVN